MSLNQLSAKRSLEKVSVFESSSHDERYTYTPLDGRSIRLLKLLPGNTGDELRCSLVTKPLQSCPQYEAVSYCWGNKEPPAYILCTGKHIRITTNLDSGLRQLRHPHEPRVLWADQICINQADIPERSAQVNIMGQIFKQAKCVVVWLGPDDEANPQAPLAISVAKKLASLPRPEDGGVWYTEEELEKHGIRPFSSNAWAAFTNFVRLPYFERVWILQEMYLASKMVMLWGKTEIDFDLLPSILDGLWKISSQDAGWTQAERYNFWSSVTIRSSNRQRSLLDLVYDARMRKAEDPRDLIFALLGMVESDFCQMSADYSKSLVDVYTTAAHTFINEFPHNLDFLSSAGTQCLAEPYEHWEVWPSWVPNFPSDFLMPTWSSRPLFAADANEPRNVAAPLHEHRKFHVHGVCVTKVSKVTRIGESEQRSEAKIYYRLLQTRNLFLDCWPANKSQPSLLSALIRTTSHGSYEEIDWESNTPPALHNMYEDFVVLVLWAAVLNLRKGNVNTFVELQDYMTIADEAVTLAWRHLPADSVLKQPDHNGVLEDRSDQSVEQIKQMCRRDKADIPARSKHILGVAEGILQNLSWTFEDKVAASKQIGDLLSLGGDPNRLIFAFEAKEELRKIFTTEDASLGKGPPATQPGDIVVILFGCRTPSILRPTNVEGEFCLIGDCYVDGIMHGEHIEQLKAEGKFEDSVTKFTLV